MANSEITEDSASKKGSKLPLVAGLVLALIGGGSGFFAVYSGLLYPMPKHGEESEAQIEEPTDLPDIGFVPLEQIIVSLGRQSNSRHLQFRAQLEVPKKHQSDVEVMVPRVIDVLNGYLRALEPSDIEGSQALIRIRAQLLRRVQMVVGDGRVNDLLVMEFVLN